MLPWITNPELAGRVDCPGLVFKALPRYAMLVG
jgi:hypothetical protein